MKKFQLGKHHKIAAHDQVIAKASHFVDLFFGIFHLHL